MMLYSVEKRVLVAICLLFSSSERWLPNLVLCVCMILLDVRAISNFLLGVISACMKLMKVTNKRAATKAVIRFSVCYFLLFSVSFFYL